MILLLTNNDNSKKLYDWLIANGEKVNIYSEKINRKKIEEINPKIVISYNYRYIIKQDVIDYMNGNIYNLHISLLPYNRGSNPNFWSFIENTPKGVTIHKVDKGLDTGNIIFQKELFFDETKESFASSYEILNNEIVELFKENWQKIRNRLYIEKEQRQPGTYHTMRDFEQYTNGHEVDWNQNIAEYKKEIIKTINRK